MKGNRLTIRSLLLIPLLLAQLSLAAQKKWIVAQDGSGDFSTVQAAFDAVPVNNKKPVVIFVKKGRYHEKLRLEASKSFVRLVGEEKFGTVLTYNDHSGKVNAAGDTINTATSQTVLIEASDFSAYDITFENSAGKTAGQAVAVQASGDRAVFRNCRFLGDQDVLFTPRGGTRQYYQDCYIEGTTDFIFGAATAWFEKCHIHSKRNSHVTAASTPQGVAFGYVFRDCVLTADTSISKVTLGRPWRPYASVTYLNCYLDRHIIPEGWNNWRNPENEKTARYAEWNSFGPGAPAGKRHGWTRQLSAGEAAAITLQKVFGNWNPCK